jgi:hypothetical protein
MKTILLAAALFISGSLAAQKMPHGVVYGKKPDRTGLIMATNLETYMGNRPRISTTLYGRVTQVTKAKGGWFDVDAGHGQIITAHFKNYGVTIPMALKNHRVIMEGVAQKQIISDDHQHYAGGGDSHAPKRTKKLLTFEVRGLMVE